MSLKDKRILFIGPLFYDYHKEIVNAMLKNGAGGVDFFEERDFSFTYRFLNNISPKLLQKYQENHYQKILNAMDGSANGYDYLFVIRGCNMPDFFFEHFSKQNPKAKKIMYQWDSMEHNDVTGILHYFDQTYSFDFRDCEEYGFLYQPLYYRFNHQSVDTSDIKYDLLYFCSFQKSRYDFLVKLIKYCKENNLRLRYFLYMRSSTYYKERMKLNPIRRSLVSFDPKPYTEIIEMMAQSRAVLDLSGEFQTGLSQRVIETVALGKKLVTFNKNIVKDKTIFQGNSVYIVDKENFNIPKDFLSEETCARNSQINDLFIDNWIKSFFEN